VEDNYIIFAKIVEYYVFCNVQMNLISRIGGKTVQETVKLLLSRLFTNKAMSFMSLEGRNHGKQAFRSHPVCQAVVGMVYCRKIVLSSLCRNVIYDLHCDRVTGTDNDDDVSAVI